MIYPDDLDDLLENRIERAVSGEDASEDEVEKVFDFDVEKDNIEVIDLFSGAGGFSRGFEKAGFDVLAGFDKKTSAVKTYNKNINGFAVEADLFKPEYGLMAGLNSDVIIGGCPCQGFSISNTSKNGHDDRNYLVDSFLNIVSVVEPKVVVLENVPNIKNISHPDEDKSWFDYICERFDDLGFSVYTKILNAYDFGIPQRRNRMFFVAVDDSVDEEFSWPDEVDIKKDVGSALFFDDEDDKLNHKKANHGKNTVKELKELKELDFEESQFGTQCRFKPHPEKPAPTLSGKSDCLIHPYDPRKLTVREYARIQSFDDEFEFIGNREEQWEQVRDAVPPKLAEEIATEIHKLF